MKSITVTTQRAINYGAVLQAYALHKIQLGFNIENSLLDYPKVKSIYEKTQIKLCRRTMISLALNSAAFFNKSKLNNLHNKFSHFVESNIKLTKVYNSITEANAAPPVADFYIDGSDQVFGLRGVYDSLRTLNFGDASIPRFSYAASLGEYDWNEKEKKSFRKILSSFKMVSVRENYAKDYIESFTDQKCLVHMDPVFILDISEWNNLAICPPIDEPYILVFPLLGNKNTQELVDKLKGMLKCKIVCIQTHAFKRINADVTIIDAGPQEFLGWVKYAQAVVTTSFHGTAFSILYKKPFYTLIKNYKSQRITDLLNMLALSDRIYTGSKTKIDLDINFEHAAQIIAKERLSCATYFQHIKEICGGKK